MKICPGCHRDYADDTLNFCLMCGTPLTDGSVQPTVAIGAEPTVRNAAFPTSGTNAPTEVIPPPRPPRKSRLPWVMLGVFVAGIVVIGWGLYIAALWQTSSTGAANSSRTEPRPKQTRRTSNALPAASPRQPDPSPTPDLDDEAAKAEDDEADPLEPTQIVWSTSAVTFTRETGRVLEFECPPDGTASAVWGTDVYTGDSSICTAAVHAGKITLEDGGRVKIEYRPGRSTYGATTRNGITTNNFGAYPNSFVIKDVDAAAH